MAKESVYPSQINTKAIACRISSVDYVLFLQDALSKGITLSDWLLMKIYSQNDNKSNLIGKEQSSGDVLNEILLFIEQQDNDYLNHIIEYNKENGIELKGSEGIISILNGLISQINLMQEQQEILRKKSRVKSNLNTTDIKAQILTLAQIKITDTKELKSFMFDVNELLEELV